MLKLIQFLAIKRKFYASLQTKMSCIFAIFSSILDVSEQRFTCEFRRKSTEETESANQFITKIRVGGRIHYFDTEVTESPGVWCNFISSCWFGIL